MHLLFIDKNPRIQVAITIKRDPYSLTGESNRNFIHNKINLTARSRKKCTFPFRFSRQMKCIKKLYRLCKTSTFSNQEAWSTSLRLRKPHPVLLERRRSLSTLMNPEIFQKSPCLLWTLREGAWVPGRCKEVPDVLITFQKGKWIKDCQWKRPVLTTRIGSW